ncbi:hypothetical protein SUGI_0441770 [Cryptomeria japonica]|nr:hypothetical protein SUGI_0441770 [Cryptomeria japonica]
MELLLCFLLLSLALSFSHLVSASFHDQFDITWGNGRANILENGELLNVSLDQTSGSGFQSKREFLFGKIDMHIKLVAGNSAGTVTAYYVSLVYCSPQINGNGYAADKMARPCHAFPFPCPHDIRSPSPQTVQSLGDAQGISLEH